MKLQMKNGDPRNRTRPSSFAVAKLEYELSGCVALNQHLYDPDLEAIANGGKRFDWTFPKKTFTGIAGQCWLNAARCFKSGRSSNIVLGYAQLPRGYADLPDLTDDDYGRPRRWWGLHTYGVNTRDGEVCELVDTPRNASMLSEWYGLILTREESHWFADYTDKFIKDCDRRNRAFNWTEELMAQLAKRYAAGKAMRRPWWGPRYTVIPFGTPLNKPWQRAVQR